MFKRFGKKILIGTVVSVMLLTGATSAFAYDGWADTPQSAYSLNGPISGVSTTINSGADIDWFKYEITEPGAYFANLQSPAGINYDFYIVSSVDGVNFNFLTSAVDKGKGALDSWSYSTTSSSPITLYFQVRGHSYLDYSNSSQYVFSITKQ